jgi:hypothetical protein
MLMPLTKLLNVTNVRLHILFIICISDKNISFYLLTTILYNRKNTSAFVVECILIGIFEKKKKSSIVNIKTD